MDHNLKNTGVVSYLLLAKLAIQSRIFATADARRNQMVGRCLRPIALPAFIPILKLVYLASVPQYKIVSTV
jgi:hypothetical protein